ncbi:MAG: hypothetical protein R2762_05345 [Bryobacteraceae bacterium]
MQDRRWENTITGSVRLFYLFDVAEEIRLADVRPVMDAAGVRGPAFRRPRREYAELERPPVEEVVPPLRMEGGEEFQARLSYFEWGVVSLELVLPWKGTWRELETAAQQWVGSEAMEVRAEEYLKGHLEQRRGAFVRPYERWLSEDYAVIQVDRAEGLRAPALLEQHGGAIARMVRGEAGGSGGRTDGGAAIAAVVFAGGSPGGWGWMAAFVYDTADGAGPTVELIEYANTQLLNLRHYDERLTIELGRVYDGLGKRRGLLARWRLAREAEHKPHVARGARTLPSGWTTR